MRTDEEIESYLLRMELPFEKAGESLWVIHDELNHIDNIVVYHDPPLITLRVKVMEVPKENREALFEKLLNLNANDLVHGAYGIEDDSIVLIDTLQSPNLDYNELQASIDALVLALREHYKILTELIHGGVKQSA